MSGKQYKILNSKMNMILQFLNDSTANNSSIFSKEEMVLLLGSKELKVKGTVKKICY